MGIHSIIKRLASRAKGHDYVIDPHIDASYLTWLTFERGVMKLRGLLRFLGHEHPPFVGRGVQLRARRLIRCGLGVTLADHTRVDAMSHQGVQLGNGTSLGRNSRIECTGSLSHLGRGFVAGNNVGLGTDCLFGAAGGIWIGDDTIIGNFVSMHSEDHNFDDPRVPIRDQGVRHEGIHIGRGCWIAAKVTVLDGVTLGDGCIVAAGAVLTRGTYADDGIYGGVPARLLKVRNRDGSENLDRGDSAR